VRGRTIGSGEVARILGCSVDTLPRYRTLGLPHFQLPGIKRPTYRYDERKVREWLAGFAVNDLEPLS
jgi:DNA-binding transcriptional MerR regulator